MFSKRHYEAIALAMQEAGNHANPGPEALQWGVCVAALADTFARDNGMFKRQRFIAACQPGANVKARG